MLSSTFLPLALINVPTPRLLTTDLEAVTEGLLAEYIPSASERPILVQLTGEGYAVIVGVDRFEARRASNAIDMLAYVIDSEYARALRDDLAALDARLAEGGMPIDERVACSSERRRIMALLSPERKHQSARMKIVAGRSSGR